MGSIGAPEIILIILALVLLFGAKKLPELARGSGRALRIFKAETKGLVDDDDDKREENRQIEAQRSTEAARPVEHQAETPAEPRRTEPER
jgi:sec-independent protein translocase protein TatA